MTAHPSDVLLEAFSLGTAAGHDVEVIEAHLEGCPACCAWVEAAPDDPFLSRVRLAARRPISTDTVAFHDPTPDPWAEAPPATLGGYRVEAELGRGGMGVVYHGHDDRLGRPVALKLMLPQLAAQPGAAERFLREARAAAQVCHDNVVTVYEANERDGVPYIAMQLLQGCPLDEYLKKEGNPSLPQLLRIARETAAGLAAAHERGLIHRDIKPSNIWLEERGDEPGTPAEPGHGRGAVGPGFRVKLLDFGLARSTAGATEISGPGTVVGTPAYMAPEQARGETIDGRADLFSLGVVLYRLGTGRLPFEGTDPVSVLLALVSHVPPPPHTVNPAIPPALSALVMQLLEKDPGRRPASARDVAVRLRQIETVLLGAPPARQPGPAPVPLHRSRLRWLVPGLAAGVLVALALGLAGALLRTETPEGTLVVKLHDPRLVVSVHNDGKAVVYEKSTKRTFALKLEKGEIHVFDRDGKRLLVTREFHLGKGQHKTLEVAAEEIEAARTRNGAPPQRWPSAAAVAEVLASPDWEWTEPEILGPKVNSPGRDYSPSVSGDGRTLVFASDRDGRDRLYEVRRPTKGERFGVAKPLSEVVNGKYFNHDPRLSDDGQTLVFSSLRMRGHIHIFLSRRPRPDAPWGPPARVEIGPFRARWLMGPSLSPDALTLVFAAENGLGSLQWDLWLCRRASLDQEFGAPVNLGPNVNTAASERSPVLWPDGLLLLFSRDGRLMYSTRASAADPFGPARPLRPANPPDHPEHSCCLASDGRTLFVCSSRPGSAREDLYVTRRVRKKRSAPQPPRRERGR